MKYAVIYQSDTGNTEKIAVKIYEELPGIDKDLCRLENMGDLPDAEYFYIGFSVFQGTCRMSVINLLSQIHDRKVAFFATCGCAVTEEYKKYVENHVRIWLDQDNEFLGFFLCQGKMPESLRKVADAWVRMMEENGVKMKPLDFNRAKLHPSAKDLREAQAFAHDLCVKQGYLLE